LRYRIYPPQSNAMKNAIQVGVAILLAALASYLILAWHA